MSEKIIIEEYKDRYIIRIKDDFNYRDFGFPISKKQFKELYKAMTYEIVKKL
jgi:hypothetical protein